MQFPESWLREFCNPPLSTQALADLLTMAGMEVEEVRPVAPPFHGVVVAEIVSAEPHPQADRLRVCQVNVGSHVEGLLQIVCGAPNARVGLRAPLAMVGAELPPGADGKTMSIGIGKLRGVESRGMLCSARELGITTDHGGLLELAGDAPPGTDLRAWMKLDDAVFTLKLTPNLGHALSVYGIAREVSALTGAPLCRPAVEPVAPTHDQRLPVAVRAADLCGRFSGRIVQGVDTRARTPAWMVDRLARCGQRSVTALVDISNYVMFEYGQPTHIFDLDKIEGGLVVRWGQPGETLELLNGNTIEVDSAVGVIADAKAVESLAGIMGGQATAVSDSTTNVFVEAAFWWPESVAGRSRRFNFSTDAGHRFERGVDPAATVACIEHITRLIQQICGGQAGPLQDEVLALPTAEPVMLRVDRAARVIGMPLTQPQCADVFHRLGFDCTESPGRISVVPPSWRFDLKIEEDLIEEVIRIVGYGQLPATAPVAPIAARVRSEGRRSTHAVRHMLAGLDYQETISFSFVEERWEHELAGNPRPIAVLNPIVSKLSAMRSSLIGSLVQVLRNNLARRAGRVRVFEIGRVFRHDADVVDGPLTVAGVSQPMRLAGLAFGPAEAAQWGRSERVVDFYDVKADIENLLAPRKPVFVADVHPALHPGRCARVELDGQAIGHIGELHPKWRQAYELPQAPVLFELQLPPVISQPVPVFKALQRLQPVWRDLALVVRDDVTHDALVAALCADTSGLVASATLFDIYKPPADAVGWKPGERSLAVRLELQPQDATLTEEGIQAVVDAALSRAHSAFGARLRT
jgi:phenylalanyl-tRNA synthetase beta chain